MTSNQPHPEKLPADAPAGPAGKTEPVVAKIPLPSGAESAAPATTQPAPANSLTPEEQMALFEKELKEKDWGHQPC